MVIVFVLIWPPPRLGIGLLRGTFHRVKAIRWGRPVGTGMAYHSKNTGRQCVSSARCCSVRTWKWLLLSATASNWNNFQASTKQIRNLDHFPGPVCILQEWLWQKTQAKTQRRQIAVHTPSQKHPGQSTAYSQELPNLPSVQLDLITFQTI